LENFKAVSAGAHKAGVLKSETKKASETLRQAMFSRIRQAFCSVADKWGALIGNNVMMGNQLATAQSDFTGNKDVAPRAQIKRMRERNMVLC
jgi:hypothetical protein